MLENHMVLNTPDAPWNAPDATGTCDMCHESADTDNVVVDGIEQSICAACDEAQGLKRDRKYWAEQLKAARPGDVVIAFHKSYRIALSVTEKYDYEGRHELWGHTMQFGDDGKAYAFSLSGHIDCDRFPDDLIDLQVVSL